MKCCKGCKKRSITCHYDPPCEDYIKEAEQIRAYRAKYLKQHEADTFRSVNIIRSTKKKGK